MSFRGILRSVAPVLSGGRRCACPIGGRKDRGVFIVLKRNRASENDASLKPDCFSASSENRLPRFAGSEKVVWIIVEPGNSMAGSASCGEFLPVGLVAALLPGISISRFFRTHLMSTSRRSPTCPLCPFLSVHLFAFCRDISGRFGCSLLLRTLTPSLVPSPTSLPFYLPVGRLVSVLCSGRSGV